jgi:hypothetical protein
MLKIKHIRMPTLVFSYGKLIFCTSGGVRMEAKKVGIPLRRAINTLRGIIVRELW